MKSFHLKYLFLFPTCLMIGLCVTALPAFGQSASVIDGDNSPYFYEEKIRSEQDLSEDKNMLPAGPEAAEDGGLLSSAPELSEDGNSLPSASEIPEDGTALPSAPEIPEDGNLLPPAQEIPEGGNSLPSAPEIPEGGNSLPPASEIPESGNLLPSAPELTGDGNLLSPAEAKPAGSEQVPAAVQTQRREVVSIEVTAVTAVGSNGIIAAELSCVHEDISRFLNRDPTLTRAAVKLEDGSRAIFPVRYDINGLDISQTGLTTLHGTIEPPDGYTIDPELSAAAIPVFLYDPQTPCELPAVSAAPVSRTQIIITDVDTEETMRNTGGFDKKIYFNLADGLIWNTAIHWDFSDVAFGAPGIYQAVARPSLPDGILLPDGISLPTCDIVIQKSGSFTLGPPDFNGLYFFSHWTKNTPDPELLHAFYAIGGGEWVEDTAGDLIRIDSSYPQYMYVFYYEDLLFETPYYFQLCYDGEYSNILKIYFSGDRIHYEEFGGDRDGGDRVGQTPPPVMQPVVTPEPNSRPSHNSDDDSGTEDYTGNRPKRGSSRDNADYQTGPGVQEAVKTDSSGTSQAPAQAERADAQSNSMPAEEETADYVVLSGKRIKKHMELMPGRPLVIEKHRIRLEIPTDTGLFTSMDDQSLFHIGLQSLPDHKIFVEISMDGVPLSDLPSLTLTVPWKDSGKSEILRLVGEDGTVLSREQVTDSGSLTFTLDGNSAFAVDGTGTLTISRTGTFAMNGDGASAIGKAETSAADKSGAAAIDRAEISVANGTVNPPLQDLEQSKAHVSAERRPSGLPPASAAILCITTGLALAYAGRFRTLHLPRWKGDRRS